MVVQLARRAARHDLAVRQDVAHVGDLRNLAHVVRDHDAADAERVVQRADQAHHHAHRDRVEAGERLVVEQDLRIHDDGAGQRHAPGHAARQLLRLQMGRAAQPDRMQLREHEVADDALRQPGVLAQREGDVLEHVEVGQQRAVLEQHAHAPAQRVEIAPLQRATSSPSTTTRPASARSWPVIRRSSVVLPVPLGPMMAVTSPRRMPMRMPRKITLPSIE